MPDESSSCGRKQIARKTRTSLEEAVVAHYMTTDIRYMRMTVSLREIYPKWLKYKSLHSSETSIPRINADWQKYYEDSAIVSKPVKELARIELDEWAHTLIREHDMTKNMYYNMSVIMRQCLDYAVELGIVEENVFRSIRIDGRRMFRKVRKKKDATQVYTRDEVLLIFREAWRDFQKSIRIVYRLAPLAVMFQFLTGLRVGELCAIKFSDIENGSLHVCRMLQRDSGKVLEHTKTYEDRDVLLPETALQIVDVARKYQEENGGIGVYAFSMTDEPLSHREVNLLLARYCYRLGIMYRSSHKARKTYISSLIDAGININTVRQFAGHADERTTYFNYCFDRAADEEKKKLLEKALR